MQGFQVRDVLGGAAQDVAGGIRQQVQAHCGNRLPGVGLLEYFDDIAAQSTGAPGPARVHRKPFQSGGEQAQEFDWLVVGHEDIIA